MKRSVGLVVIGILCSLPLIVWERMSRYDSSQEAAVEMLGMETIEIARIIDCNGTDSGNGLTLMRPGYQIDLTDPNILSDASIRLLCASGRICKLMGHQWKWLPPVEVLHQACSRDLNAPRPKYDESKATRQCALCYIVVTKPLSEWHD